MGMRCGRSVRLLSLSNSYIFLEIAGAAQPFHLGRVLSCFEGQTGQRVAHANRIPLIYFFSGGDSGAFSAGFSS